MLVVKAMCKECYNKRHGELTPEGNGKLYRITDEIKKCEICGKVDTLIQRLEKFEGELLKIKDMLK